MAIISCPFTISLITCSSSAWIRVTLGSVSSHKAGSWLQPSTIRLRVRWVTANFRPSWVKLGKVGLSWVELGLSWAENGRAVGVRVKVSVGQRGTLEA